MNAPPSPRRTPAKPDLEIWRRTLHVSDLFRIVAKKGADNEHMNRITVNQARIFGYIFSRSGEGPIRISKLAHDLDVTPAAAGQAVDRLVKAGMVDAVESGVAAAAKRSKELGC